MTDEEIKEYAKNKILDACRQVGLLTSENNRPLVFRDENKETKVKIDVTEKGQVIFMFYLISSIGTGIIHYSPQPFIETITHKMRVDMKATPEKSGDITPDEVYKIWDNHITNIANAIAAIVVAEFEESVLFLAPFAEDVVDFLTSIDLGERSERQKKQWINDIILARGHGKIERMLEMEKQQVENLIAPQYLFGDVYEEQKKIWKKAKLFYKKSKKDFANSLEITKTAFQTLPEDLVEKFASLDSYEASPSMIAFEATARLLNVPNAITSESSFRRYLKESGEQRKKVSDKEAERARREFFERGSMLNRREQEILVRVRYEVRKITRPNLKDNSVKLKSR